MPKLIWLPLALASLAFAADEAGEQLLAAARKGDVAAAKALLDKGANVNAKNRYGSTPLFFACDRGHFEVAKLLLDRGADANVHDTFYNASPLTWAFSKQHTQLVDLLLERGADAGEALQMSVGSSNKELFEKVLAKGKLSKPQLDEGLLLASTAKQEEMAKKLESLGAVATPTKVSEAEGKAFAGRYQEGDMTINIMYKDEKLSMGTSPLIPQGGAKFKSLFGGTKVEFVPGAEGAPATHIVVDTRGGQIKIKRAS